MIVRAHHDRAERKNASPQVSSDRNQSCVGPVAGRRGRARVPGLRREQKFYPDSRIPAHVHAYVSGPGYPEYWIDEYHFADDPFVTSDMKARDEGKGNQSSIVTLTRGADGILRGVRDIVIERCSKNCTGR